MGAVVILSFFFLFIIGMPIIIAIGLPSIVYLILNEVPISMVAKRMHFALDSFTLVAVPIFIFAGNIMNTTGITKRIFRFADSAVGRIPGGLAQVNIFASLIFSGMSGAALADVGGLGKIEIQAMKEKGFSNEYSGAVTCASATIGPIFPPSIPLVIYGSVASVSIVKLLIAGIVPAVLAVILLMITTVFLAYTKNLPRSERWPSIIETWNTFFPAFPALMAPVILVVGMLSGIFTATESASVTVFYMVLISLIFYKELTWKSLFQSAFETIKSSAAILIIIAVASLFGWILAVEQIPQMFSSSLLAISSNQIIMLIIINAILLLVGMFLDSTTATLLVIPIIAAPVIASGVDPVHLGIIAIFNLMIGLVTPPMGLSLFMISNIAGTKMSSIIKEMLPYFIPLFIMLAIITFIPEISLWLPGFIE